MTHTINACRTPPSMPSYAQRTPLKTSCYMGMGEALLETMQTAKALGATPAWQSAPKPTRIG